MQVAVFATILSALAPLAAATNAPAVAGPAAAVDARSDPAPARGAAGHVAASLLSVAGAAAAAVAFI